MESLPSLLPLFVFSLLSTLLQQTLHMRIVVGLFSQGTFLEVTSLDSGIQMHSIELPSRTRLFYIERTRVSFHYTLIEIIFNG